MNPINNERAPFIEDQATGEIVASWVFPDLPAQSGGHRQRSGAIFLCQSSGDLAIEPGLPAVANGHRPAVRSNPDLPRFVHAGSLVSREPLFVMTVADPFVPGTLRAGVRMLDDVMISMWSDSAKMIGERSAGWDNRRLAAPPGALGVGVRMLWIAVP